MKRFFLLIVASLMISLTLPSIASANSAASLVNTGKSFLGVKYKYGGTTAAGFDCSGYTQVVFKKSGVSIPRTTGAQYSTGTPVAKSNLKTGDLVFFNTSGRGVSHVGIYVGSNNFMHASTSQGVMISSINDPYYWGSRYVGARRVANLSTETASSAASTPAVQLPTRGDVAELLSKELGLSGDAASTLFKDVSTNHPQAADIHAVAIAGIFSGNGGNFNPSDNLTRAEMAKVLVEAFGLTGSSNVSFNDVAADNWANPYIQTLYALDITKGLGNGNFGVNDKVTSSQLKMFIERIQNK